MIFSIYHKNNFLFDTTVYIDYFHAHENALKILQESMVNRDRVSRSVVTEAELLVGAKDKDEVRDCKILLAPHRPLAVTQQIAHRAAELSKLYWNGKNLLDMIIAATAEISNCILVSRNPRHFRKLAEDGVLILYDYSMERKDSTNSHQSL